MAHIRSRMRALGAVVALAVLLPSAQTFALGAQAASSGAADQMRGRAGKFIVGLDSGTLGSGAATAPSGPTTQRKSATQQQDSSQSLTATALNASYCDTSDLWIESLTDRNIIHAARAGAATLTLMRMRNQGAWVTIGTFTGNAVTYTDRGVSPRVPSAYRMVAKDAAGRALIDCADSGIYNGVWTDDGWGAYDAVAAHSTALVIQSRWSLQPTPTVSGGSWITPSFSADGRLVAVSRINPDTGAAVLEMRRSRNGALVFTVDPGPEVSLADPAFSFDGQTLAYSRYDTVTGAPLGLGFVDVHGAHVTRELTADVPVAEPAWRPNGTLIVSTFGAWEGLANLCATCTTVRPIQGTDGGYTAEVGSDNTVYFTVTTDTVSALKKISPAGSMSTMRTSEIYVYVAPRLSPSGLFFVERESRPEYSSSPVPEIMSVDPSGPAGDEYLDIGRYDRSPYGYDVRQPFTKGMSHFVGDAKDDLVVRDGYGKLWAYAATDRGLGSRTQIGSGWSTYTAVVPVGDLTSDDRPDLLGRDAYGKLWLYPGVGNGKFAARVQMGTGWNPYTLVSPGDWNGDDKADLIARDSSGYLWLYPGNGTGRLGARNLIGSGWGSFTAILGSGDANFDNKADLIARDGAGRLWLYPGNGKGGFLAKRQIGSGWGGFTALTVTEVTNQETRVWARTSAGQLVYYPISGDGQFLGGHVPLGYGWKGLLITS